MVIKMSVAFLQNKPGQFSLGNSACRSKNGLIAHSSNEVLQIANFNQAEATLHDVSVDILKNLELRNLQGHMIVFSWDQSCCRRYSCVNLLVSGVLLYHLTGINNNFS